MTAIDQGNKPDPDPAGSANVDDAGSSGKGRRFQWGLLVGAVVAVAAALLVIQNGQHTTVEWLWLDFDTSLWLVVVASLAGGIVIGEGGRLAWRHSRKRAADRRNVTTAGRRPRHS